MGTIEKAVYSVAPKVAQNAHIDKARYVKDYQHSMDDNDGFWGDVGQRIDWFKPYTQIKDVSYAKDDLYIRWYADGELNVSYNCLDRHLSECGEQAAIVWQADDPEVSRTLTYRELHAEVCRFANVLIEIGVKVGDRVTIYMPMIPEAAIAMLACTRIGAVHSVVFGGFSPDALAGRIIDCDSTIVITADGGFRGGQAIALKANVDQALQQAEVAALVHKVLVVQHANIDVAWHSERDVWYHPKAALVDNACEAVAMPAEAPLFILYTSGSTGTPKGVLHTTGGYLVYASYTHEMVFDYRSGEVYWCTADIGWITGHSYIVYGPLANGATTLMFEGVPTYPDAGRFWQICDQHQVNIFYTAPTAIRALMGAGNAPVEQAQLKSLRLLGTVGEPINPQAWQWYYEVVGKQQCPIVDTWWQTETGGILISPLVGATDLKPGSATQPLPGIETALVDTDGHELEGEASGHLVIKQSWPGQMRTVYGDHKRFIDTYFSTYPGCYFTGDGARRDAVGDYWITGRVDDVLNVSGHRLGTAEIESALVAHDAVAEAAVVGVAHPIKGQGIYAYVTLMAKQKPSDALKAELIAWVRKNIGAIATLDYLQWAPGLPKTRSGKIMRRILRKIANNDDQLGDTSTLADPSVIEALIEQRQVN